MVLWLSFDIDYLLYCDCNMWFYCESPWGPIKGQKSGTHIKINKINLQASCEGSKGVLGKLS